MDLLTWKSEKWKNFSQKSQISGIVYGKKVSPRDGKKSPILDPTLNEKPGARFVIKKGLQAMSKTHNPCYHFGEPCRARTHDHLIKSISL
jgi:hypothetical protein